MVAERKKVTLYAVHIGAWDGVPKLVSVTATERAKSYRLDKRELAWRCLVDVPKHLAHLTPEAAWDACLRELSIQCAKAEREAKRLSNLIGAVHEARRANG